MALTRFGETELWRVLVNSEGKQGQFRSLIEYVTAQDINVVTYGLFHADESQNLSP